LLISQFSRSHERIFPIVTGGIACAIGRARRPQAVRDLRRPEGTRARGALVLDREDAVICSIEQATRSPSFLFFFYSPANSARLV
jgi:hypothetical protein